VQARISESYRRLTLFNYNNNPVDSTRLIETKLSEKKEAFNLKQLKELKKELKQEMLSYFKKKSIGNEEELRSLYSELDKQFMERYSSFKEKNKSMWIVRKSFF
jgi:hypothetical protein